MTTLALACCKVGLDRPLIPTAVVANLFRSASVSRPRCSADRRSQVTRRQSGTGRAAVAEDEGSGDHCPDLDGRAVGKSRQNRSSGSHQRPRGDGRHGCHEVLARVSGRGNTHLLAPGKRGRPPTSPGPLFSRPAPRAAGRELGLFSGSIPPWFVLSHNLPRINITSNWLCFGAFRTPPSRSLRLH